MNGMFRLSGVDTFHNRVLVRYRKVTELYMSLFHFGIHTEVIRTSFSVSNVLENEIEYAV